MNNKVSKIIILIISAIMLIIFSFFLYKQNSKIQSLENKINKFVQIQENNKLFIENKITNLTKTTNSLNTENKKTLDKLNKLEISKISQTKNQEERVTDAVAKTANSVISIIATKDMPKVEVTYENPFSNDPNFKNFNIRIPVLKTKGTEVVKIGAGTGFIITSNGYILTNRHVVADVKAEYTAILSNGIKKTAKVIYRDKSNDIAILKISGANYQKVSLGNSLNLKLGQTVIAIGNALGEYNNSVSIGIISGLNRNIVAKDRNGNSEILSGIIQTDAAINPGNSGGPLVNLSGQVIGINVATVIGSNNVSFAIPITIIKQLINNILGSI